MGDLSRLRFFDGPPELSVMAIVAAFAQHLKILQVVVLMVSVLVMNYKTLRFATCRAPVFLDHLPV
jgi:hypothetical protein